MGILGSRQTHQLYAWRDQNDIQRECWGTGQPLMLLSAPLDMPEEPGHPLHRAFGDGKSEGGGPRNGHHAAFRWGCNEGMKSSKDLLPYRRSAWVPK